MALVSVTPINTGTTANDNTGDSIRVAFTKANQNFAALNTSLGNLYLTGTDGLKVTGPIDLQTGSTVAYFTGTFKIRSTALDTFYDIASVNRTFDGGSVAGVTSFTNATESASVLSGAVTVTGGLGVGGTAYLKNMTVPTGGIATVSTTLELADTSTTNMRGQLNIIGTNPISATSANLNISGVNATLVSVTGNVATLGNVWGGNIVATTGNLYSLGQAFITGNATVANLNVGNVAASGNITATKTIKARGNVISSSFVAIGSDTGLTDGNAYVSGNVFTGNVTAYGQISAANITVKDVPTIYSVTNKQYVNTQIIGFAIGLGS